MSLLSDKYAAAAKAKPQDVKYDTFTEHGLGDKYKSKKEPNHSAASEVKKLNKQLKAINAPFYAVCKDNGKIGYRKVKPSCDADHPNVTYARKKTVDEALQIEAVIEADEKDEKKAMKKEKPAEKPSEKQDKPHIKTYSPTKENTAIVKALKKISGTKWVGNTTFENIQSCLISINLSSGKNSGLYDPVATRINGLQGIYMVNQNGNLEPEYRIIKEADKKYRIESLTTAGYNEFEQFYGKFIDEKSAEKEPKKSSDDDDRDAKSAKILEMIEAKFNKILESKG